VDEGYIPVGSSADPAEDDWELTPTAHAAVVEEVPDAGVADASVISAMPEDPSHITVPIPKMDAANLAVGLLSSSNFPYRYEVADSEDHFMLTLYLPRGREISLAVSPVQADGESVGDILYYTMRPYAKLATAETSGYTVYSFQTGAETTLALGRNTLATPITEEYIGGRIRRVQQGVFTATRAGTYRISWEGAPELHSFVDGPPESRRRTFDIYLSEGQTLGLYPVFNEELDAACETATIHIEAID
jgi:hypothetical protein